MLSVIGAINWDISIFEDRFARSGEEVPVRRVEEFSGGKAANVAVAAARILGSGRVACIGALGDDQIAKAQIAELVSEGVTVEGIVEVKGRQSGRAYILVDAEGRKTIHTHFGANAEITSGDIRERGCAKVISKTGAMVVMDPPTPVALAAAEAARSHGAKVIYSPGVRTQEGVKTLDAILRISDFLVVDRIELMNLDRAADEEKVLGIVNKKHPRVTVVATFRIWRVHRIGRQVLDQSLRRRPLVAGHEGAEHDRLWRRVPRCLRELPHDRQEPPGRSKMGEPRRSTEGDEARDPREPEEEGARTRDEDFRDRGKEFLGVWTPGSGLD